MKTFKDWKEAREYAQASADNYGMSYGIEALKAGYDVFMLPNPENRQGRELRAECVDPSPQAKDRPAILRALRQLDDGMVERAKETLRATLGPSSFFGG